MSRQSRKTIVGSHLSYLGAVWPWCGRPNRGAVVLFPSMMWLVFLALILLLICLIWFCLREQSLSSEPSRRGYIRVSTEIPFEIQPETLPIEGRETTKQFKVLIATWNMGDKPAAESTLPSLTRSPTNPEALWDFIIVGTQECYYKPRSGFSSCEADWVDAITQAACNGGPGIKYVAVDHVHLRDSIRIVVLVRSDLRSSVTNVRTAFFNTAPLPYFWRKGAVACSFNIFEHTSLCFINVHLPAHDYAVQARNDDAKTILRELRLGNPNFDAGNQFSHCFFFGDLNYRVDSSSKDDVVAAVRRQEFSYLHHRDQLLTEQRRGNSLSHFLEPSLPMFAPTFKVTRGTRDGYDPKRMPSWCDRILWSSLPDVSTHVKSLFYESADNVLSSDHIPVIAGFELQVPILSALCSPWPQHRFVFRLTDIELELTYPPAQQFILQTMSPSSFSTQAVRINPRLVVSAPFLEKEAVKSHPIQNAVTTAYWPEMAEFSSTLVPKEVYLTYQHLFIAVYDYKWEGREELFAQATISLRPHVGCKTAFAAPLYFGGIKRGLVRANLIVQ